MPIRDRLTKLKPMSPIRKIDPKKDLKNAQPLPR